MKTIVRRVAQMQTILIVLIGALVLGCQHQHKEEVMRYYHPSMQLGDLFHAVQMEAVFEDSKTFVDSTPKAPLPEVLTQYQTSSKSPDFDLAHFIAEYFDAPKVVHVQFDRDINLSMEQHLRSHWDYLTRASDSPKSLSTLIPLPYPYVVPGGRFREVYYWDSYFTMHGLVVSDQLNLVENMLDNFAWLIDQVGHIPNGNRTYYLGRSQPPFFAAMVSLYQQHQGDEAALAFITQLEKEYQFWMDGVDTLAPGDSHRRVVRLEDGSILNRYYDDLETPRPESYREDVITAQVHNEDERPRVYRDIRAAAESGWDFSSRWFSDNQTLASIQTTQIVPVDLNSLLFHLESTLSQLHTVAGNESDAGLFNDKAKARKAAINQWLWDKQQQSYGDLLVHNKKVIGTDSLAITYPMYFNIATSERADATANRIEQYFLKAGGLVTTLNNTGEQWDHPNGWAPLQWLAIKGLSQYGHDDLSQTIAQRWLALNRKVFNETGRMMEKYNVVDTSLHAGGGEYALQDGFGWTNGVVLAIIAHFQPHQLGAGASKLQIMDFDQ